MSATSKTDPQAREPETQLEAKRQNDDASSSEIDNDNASIVSTTSTIEWEHEPYETFQHKVAAYAHRRLWPTINPTDVRITRMAGGGFNRIIGVSRLNPKGREVGAKYIIRIPRYADGPLWEWDIDVGKDAAALRFVEQQTSIPVPRVVSITLGDDNELDRAHMIQRCVKGRSAMYVYLDCDHQVQCRLATELGNTFGQILNTQSRIPGVPVFPHAEKPTTGTAVRIAPLPAANPRNSLPYEACQTAEPIPVLQFIETMLEHRKQVLRNDMDTKHLEWELSLYDMLRDLAREINAKGYFDDVPYTLIHKDLQAHNILVNENPFPGDAAITSIMDWDGALLGPAFMACVPPQWLWGWVHDDDEDEAKANDVPETAENREIKRLFEEAAGPLYMRFAYDPVYRIGRSILRYCFCRIGQNSHLEEIDGAVAKWKALQQTEYRSE
ncbi:hypothetical protein B0H67DRAFT_666424 [Lasiosphaeris hirsuta]|uniref:Aminoglycoside phosphotransferase domain-containing protein n=1 Tax=Lasiosphaeris hirsuta TaxID=260670 RepID=A0AA40DUD2_9PEZI|nr:hypothetical protein B0H67DRAFT_666424 [Lasiosphaeris hirsuta]